MSERFEFRAAEPAEYADLLRVWRRSYGDAWPEEPSTPHPHQEFFIGRWQERASFACSIFDFPTYVRGATLRCAGVSGVATVPEARNSGLASQAMNALLGECRDRGFALASLYGFRDTFYRKFGYASCGWRWQITCPTDRLPSVRSSLPVREIDVANLMELDACYQRFAQGLNGACKRNENHWRRRMGKNPPVIYAVGDPIEGYLWTNVTGFWNDLEIGEFTWSTPAGYNGLLALLRDLSINKKRIIWPEPPDSPYLAHHIDSEVDARWFRHTMFRIIDPKAVVEATGGTELSFEIDDPVFVENREKFGSGPTVSLGIPALTQGILGDPGFTRLAQHEYVRAEPEALAQLTRIFPEAPVCCMEFF